MITREVDKSALSDVSVKGTPAGHSNSTDGCNGSVLLEHSYCLSNALGEAAATSASTSSSSSRKEAANGCDSQSQQHLLLTDPPVEQLAQIDDKREQQQQQDEEEQQPEEESDPLDGSSGSSPATSSRSRRVRRLPAKLMSGNAFDDMAEFPKEAPTASDPKTPVVAQSDKSERQKMRNKKKSIKVTSGHKSIEEKAPQKESDSESEEEDEDEDDDDDDPYKEYCICRKPHGNRFMIACDHCEDWFHGSCIGLTKKQAEMYESWICQTCRDNDPTLHHVLKEKTPKSKPVTSGRKSLTSQHASDSSSIDSEDEKPLQIAHKPVRPVKKRNSSGGGSRPKAIKDKNGLTSETDKEDAKEKLRLRELIEKAKREHAEKLKRRERRQGPLDPTMNQLFQVTDQPSQKSQAKTSPSDSSQRNHRIKCMICRSERVNSDKTIYCSLNCMKQHVKKAKRKKHEAGIAEISPDVVIMYPVFDAFDVNDLPESKRKKEDVAEKELIHFLIRNPGFALDPDIKVKAPSVRKLGLDLGDTASRKASVSEGSKTPSTPGVETPTTGRKRPLGDDSSGERGKESSRPAGLKRRESQQHHEDKNSGSKGRSEDLHMQLMREKALKGFQDALEKRANDVDDLPATEKTRRKAMTSKLAQDIEKCLFESFQTDDRPVLTDAALKNYVSKCRTLILNFSNVNNKHLLHSLFSPKDSNEHVSAHEVVRMTPEELARGSDLDAWRKVEARKSLINSVVVNEESSDGPKLKKTRKGEEEIQNDSNTNDEMFVRTPSLDASREKTSVFNPLEMILNEIKSSSKSSDKRNEIEDVPKSPDREDGFNAIHSSPDAPISPVKKRRSFLDSEDDSSKSMSRSEVKRVKVTPEITSILSTSLPPAEISENTASDIPPSTSYPTDQQQMQQQQASGRGERKILWQGFCSGFEDPTASSSFNPALSSSSRFPLICRTLVSDHEVDSERLPVLPPALNVVGRIAPEQVSSYVQKLVQSSGETATGGADSIIEMIPLTLKHKHMSSLDFDFHETSPDPEDDDDEALLFRENFNKFINYLIQRKRYAVVDVKSTAQSKKSNLKDVYLLPFSIPLTGEVSRSSQLPSKMMADLFDSGPFTQELRDLKPRKPIAILLMLLIKKGTISNIHSTAVRDRSGSSSSSSTTSSSVRHTSHRSLRESKSTEERSFTPPPPHASSGHSSSYVPTPISRSVSLNTGAGSAGHVSESGEEEYDPGSYIPGFSPDRSSSNKKPAPDNKREEDELRQKALLQMRMLHP